MTQPVYLGMMKVTNMKNNKFVTYSGIEINFDNFTADMVCLEDIAHHLTNINRYGGSLPLDTHYSVAQHSLELVNYLHNNFDPDTRYTRSIALLHDASEAYLGDVIFCLKARLDDYRELEGKIAAVIYDKYLATNNGYFPYCLGAKWANLYSHISELDKKIVNDEMFWLGLTQEYDSRECLEVKIVPQPKELVKQSFLYCAAWLGLKD